MPKKVVTELRELPATLTAQFSTKLQHLETVHAQSAPTLQVPRDLQHNINALNTTITTYGEALRKTPELSKTVTDQLDKFNTQNKQAVVDPPAKRRCTAESLP